MQPANPKYFVLAQYTRHIRPGMEILPSSDPETALALDSTTHKLILVICNDGPAREISCDLSACASAVGPVTRWLTEPKGRSRHERSDLTQALTGKILRLSLPAYSVETAEINGVAR